MIAKYGIFLAKIVCNDVNVEIVKIDATLQAALIKKVISGNNFTPFQSFYKYIINFMNSF